MKKVYKYLCVSLISFMLLLNGVFAAGYSTSVTSNSVTVGGSVTLNIKGSDIAGKFTISSSNNSVVGLSTGSVWIDNNTQSITLKANNVGTSVITIVPADVSSYSGDTITGNKTITITVKAKPVVSNNSGTNNNGGGSSSNGNSYAPKPKSSNSYLSSLTVDGYELDSKFDKETLEYSVVLKEGTEKIKINAQLADSSAKVTGVGEVSVSEGINTFELVVTAENGSKRTYILKATVKEYQSIKVKVNGEEFTVVRKRKDLPVISEYFTEKEITIDGELVEGYYNETLKYEVIGLKDNSGDIKYYIYDNGDYSLYNEQVFNGKILRIIDKKLEGGYKKTSFSYNDTKIDSYQEVKLDIIKNTYALDNNEIVGNSFYLFYAINLETGEEELYQYDAMEKTVQRYNTLVLDMYKEQSEKYYLYLLISLLILGFVLVTFSMIVITSKRRNKRKSKKKKIKKSENNGFDDEELAIKNDKID